MSKVMLGGAVDYVFACDGGLTCDCIFACDCVFTCDCDLIGARQGGWIMCEMDIGQRQPGVLMQYLRDGGLTCDCIFVCDCDCDLIGARQRAGDDTTS